MFFMFLIFVVVVQFGNVMSVDEVLWIFEVLVDIVWVFIVIVFVFFMQFGFVFFEGGVVCLKNIINVIMKNYIDMCVGGLVFVFFGFGIMFGFNLMGWFGQDKFGFVGLFDFEFIFVFFQMMFVVIVVMIVLGVFVECICYCFYVVCLVVLILVIYIVFGSWVWGSNIGGIVGWLCGMGFQDFVGLMVVYLIGGWVVFVGIVVFGLCFGCFLCKGEVCFIFGYNLIFVVVGGFIFWVGWFGFNGGSIFKVDVLIGVVVFNMYFGGIVGVSVVFGLLFVMCWFILFMYMVNGGFGGLVVIIVNVNNVMIFGVIVMGVVVGLFVIGGMLLFECFQFDDFVGVVFVYGVCGVWGILVVVFFGVGGFDFQMLFVQFVGVGVVFVWGFLVGWIMFKLVDCFVGFCVMSVEEQCGFDFVEYYEVGYFEFFQDQLYVGRG